MAQHPLYEHIVPQVTKFYNAIKNHATRRKLIDAFYDEIGADIQLEYKFKSTRIKKELYKVLTDIINENPYIIIIIDAKTNELEEVCESLPFATTVLGFETFYRENSNVPIHIFDTLKDYNIEYITTPTLEERTVVSVESRKTYSYKNTGDGSLFLFA